LLRYCSTKQAFILDGVKWAWSLEAVRAVFTVAMWSAWLRESSPASTQALIPFPWTAPTVCAVNAIAPVGLVLTNWMLGPARINIKKVD
jgi:hypothetical protein